MRHALRYVAIGVGVVFLTMVSFGVVDVLANGSVQYRYVGHQWLWLLVIPIGIVWTQTGKSPFVWISIGAMLAEAVRIQLYRSSGHALRHFRLNWRSAYVEVKEQLREPGIQERR